MKRIAVPVGLLVATLAVPASSMSAPAEPAAPSPAATPYPIDLATALRLAGANAIDVQIARERLNAAKAVALSTLTQLLPWLSAGTIYRRHGALIQDVVGNMVTADKESYTVGPSVNLQVDVGDTVFRTLAARQAARAADRQVETQQQEVLLRAAQAYFDLLEAQAFVAAATESLDISRTYESQLQRAVEAGIAFKGDALRVRVQAQRNQLTLQQAREQQRIQAARLAEILRLDPAVALIANDIELAPLAVTSSAGRPIDDLVRQAVTARPEIAEAQSLVQAATETEKAAVYGPLIPTVAGQAFLGGLGGGKQAGPSTFGASRDYFATIGWRIGPGGLFDVGRVRASRARLAEAKWSVEKLRDSVARQVVEARTRVGSQEQQLETAKDALAAAEEALRLTRARQEFEVGVVLENILAEQDQARARQDYARTLGEFNKAQYGLSRALGLLQTATQGPTAPQAQP
jgi:outer membrane protein TolC